jgi:hypothetical protein
MARVEIPAADSITWNDFDQKNSVQVRVTVPASQADEFNKGNIVEVVHEQHTAKGKIVSEPLAIDDKTSKDKKVLSLIVEKV